MNEITTGLDCVDLEPPLQRTGVLTGVKIPFLNTRCFKIDSLVHAQVGVIPPVVGWTDYAAYQLIQSTNRLVD